MNDNKYHDSFHCTLTNLNVRKLPRCEDASYPWLRLAGKLEMRLAVCTGILLQDVVREGRKYPGYRGRTSEQGEKVRSKQTTQSSNWQSS